MIDHNFLLMSVYCYYKITLIYAKLVFFVHLIYMRENTVVWQLI